MGRMPGAGRRTAERLLRWYLRKAFARCSAVIAPSEYARSILTWAGVENTVVVPHGIEIAERRKGKGEGFDGVRGPVALYAGRLSQEKGLDTVLRALPRLHAATSVHVVMVGEGHLRAKFETFAGLHPELLTVLPYQRDRDALADLYRRADVVLAPCPYETFGLSAVEAMALGTPVVGADAGAIAELIGQTGGGVTFEPGNPHAFVDAVTQCLERSDELGDLARTGARIRFAADQTMLKLVDVYRGAMDTE
jgi:glycosyltransferase involved in cell wall biosynthesis